MIVHPQMPHIPNTPHVWLDVLAMIVIGTLIPFQLMSNSLRFIKASTASLLDAFEPFSATLGSVLCFGLVMTPMDWIGSILVVLAAMALNISPKKKKGKLDGKAKTRRLWTFLAAMAAVMWGISGLFAKGLFNISSKITPMWLTQIQLDSFLE